MSRQRDHVNVGHPRMGRQSADDVMQFGCIPSFPDAPVRRLARHAPDANKMARRSKLSRTRALSRDDMRLFSCRETLWPLNLDVDQKFHHCNFIIAVKNSSRTSISGP